MVGQVTPVSSLFSAEEAQKASELVQEKITERRQQLDVLKGFICDNLELINTIHVLPNELQYQIMVPFGNAAFFPGRLIHTNELMVLLGDGYYAERTSKQTVDILQRRHRALESQIESARAEIQDLKAEASFFDDAADEVASGLVQIVEDYTEEVPFQEASSKVELPSSPEAEQGKSGNIDDDDEYERMFAKLEAEEAAALEVEEAAGSGDESVEGGDDFDDLSTEFSTGKVVKQANSSRQPPLVPDVISETRAGSPAPSKLNTSKNALKFPESKRSVQDPAKPELPQRQQNVQAPAVAKHEVSVPPLQQNTSVSKVVIGSIIEHAHSLDTKRREDTVADSSKPVSRFKMNRK